MTNCFNNELFAAMLESHAQGYTLRELEELTGVSAPTISRLMRLKTIPDVDNLYALCVWMDVSPGAFMLPQATDTVSATEQTLKRALQQIAEIASRF